MRVKAKRRTRHKDSGKWIEVGEDFELITPSKDNPEKCTIIIDIDTQFNFPTNLLAQLFYGFEYVSLEDLQEGVFDSLCKTVKGNYVEPDGWDQQGFPSCLLAAGMI